MEAPTIDLRDEDLFAAFEVDAAFPIGVLVAVGLVIWIWVGAGKHRRERAIRRMLPARRQVAEHAQEPRPKECRDGLAPTCRQCIARHAKLFQGSPDTTPDRPAASTTDKGVESGPGKGAAP